MHFPVSIISIKLKAAQSLVSTHLEEQEQGVFLAELEVEVDLWTDACCPDETVYGSASLHRCHLHFPCRGGARAGCALLFNFNVLAKLILEESGFVF